MKLKLLLTVLAVFFIASNTQAQELTQLSDHVYGYVGTTGASPSANSYGANCGVVVGDDAVMVIDTLISAKKAKKLISQIKTITNKPIKYVVNTHHHLDHSWGNSEFKKLGAIIIGQSNTPQDKEEINTTIAQGEGYGLTPEDLEGTQATLPSITFQDSLNVDLGGISVELNYPGPSHTDDSITAFIPEDNVLFVGDILFNKYHPYLGEADIPSWIDILAEIDNTSATIIVPGHGPLATKDDILDFAVYLTDFDSNATNLCEGKTQADAPELAKKMMELLPEQGRTELPNMIETNLRMKYLPHNETDQY